MAQYAELLLEDGTVIRLQLSPVGGPQTGDVKGGGRGVGGEFTKYAESDGDHEYGADEDDLPGGVGGAEPAGRIRDAARTLARGSLRGALSPLGPLLREVHSVVSSVDNPPHEFNVQFGLQLGQDLKLGIVDVKSASSVTVSATWRPAPETSAGAGPGMAS
ncbi:CU044_2847 family protein [Streptomyces sp. NPDC001480]|uniref:CU044_2847 family protein n=1 Tax=Streptomyces sp. NPDC001480 TaxID=3364577 RepID=UPI0036BADDD8